MEGEMNMCLAIDEMVQDGVEEGIGKINLLNAKLIADGRLKMWYALRLIRSFRKT